MTKPTIYVVINKELGMSTGKVATQAGHAVAGLDTSSWLEQPQRWVIVLEAASSMILWNLNWYLADRDVPTFPVVDEGANEIPPMSITAVGVGPIDKDSLEAKHLGGFKTYSSDVAPCKRALWPRPG